MARKRTRQARRSGRPDGSAVASPPLVVAPWLAAPATAAGLPLRYYLYEVVAQAPGPLVRFLHAVHGGSPRVLREDFSGTGAVCRAWAAVVPGGRAIAVDRDPEPLAALAGVAGVEAVCADVLAAPQRADVVAATNFPIGYWHTRAGLLAYLRRTRSRLRAGGVFVCDLYGGSHAFITGSMTQRLTGPRGERIEYTWEQARADPLTGRVVDAMHFRVRRPGRVRPTILRDAFVYDWRLWSIAELREAMDEAGFRSTEVHNRLGEAIDERGRAVVRPVEDPAELGEDYVVYVVARK